MVLVLTVPHSLPFRQSLLKAVSPPDVYTFSIETSETALETRARRTFSTTSPSGFSSEKADQRRHAFSTATSLDLDTPYCAQRRPCFAFRSRLATAQCRQAQPSEKAFRSKSANRYLFDLFRSTVSSDWDRGFRLARRSLSEPCSGPRRGGLRVDFVTGN